MIRTYKFSSQDTNTGKIDKIRALSREYKIHANDLLGSIMRAFYETGKVKTFPAQPETESILSARYKQVAGQQTTGLMESWLGNIENRIRDVITYSFLSSDEKIALYFVNKYHLWYWKEVRMRKVQIPDHLMRLSRKLFHACRGRSPKMRRTTMILSEQTVHVEKAENSFDYWIKLSTLEKGNPIYLPIQSYRYFEKQKGEIKNAVQIQIDGDNITYGLIRDMTPSPMQNMSGVIGIDIGLVNLITTSNGDRYGRRLYRLLKHYDERIQNLIRGRQKDNLPVRCKEYDRLIRIVHNLIKNEVGRCLNRMIATHKPEVVCVENLTGITKNTARDKRLSRRMRRILINSGVSKIENRLKAKGEEYGFKVEPQNSAYTSQECPRCHYVDDKNRKGERFHCLHCRYIKHADYVGAVNQVNRRSVPEITIYTSRQRAKEILQDRFLRHEAEYRSAMSGTIEGLKQEPVSYGRFL